MATRDQVRLHRVSEADWRSHRELRLQMLADSPDAFRATLDEAIERTEKQWRSGLSRAQHIQAIALDGSPVGTVGVMAGPWRSEAELVEDAVGIIAMYVTPTARGQGVGDALLKGATAYTQELGRRQMRLDVTSNNYGAIKLYQRQGFTFTGQTIAHPRRADLVEREMRRLV